MKKIMIFVDNPGELAAGLRSYTDELEIIVKSGNPGGEPGEFESFICEAIAEWYDGSKVTITQIYNDEN